MALHGALVVLAVSAFAPVRALVTVRAACGDAEQAYARACVSSACVTRNGHTNKSRVVCVRLWLTRAPQS